MLRTFNFWLALAIGGSLLFVSPATTLSAALLSPPATGLSQQTSEPVYALQGTLGKVENQNFATYLLSADGVAYALVGETPAVEAEITRLRDQRAIVKVWGTLYPQGRVSATPEIVVADILAESSTPAPTPAAQPTAVVRSGIINIRTGPGTNYESVGTLAQGTSCTINGRDPDNTWWQVQCTTGLTGWIFQQLVDTAGNTASIPVAAVPPPPPPPATPAPPPAPTTFYGWRAEYFPNRNLSGNPSLIQDIPEVNLDWGTGGPTGLPVDGFSSRFTRTINFNPGSYRFHVRSDDGVRVFIDDQLVIDQWHVGSGNIDYTADRSMYGNQTVRIEHYEDTGLASIHFYFESLANSSPIDGGGSGDWQVSYYNNPNLSGNPALTRREARSSYPLDADWGNGSPAPGIIADDNWSARWVGTFNFEAGDYLFQARSDDGVRVYIDGIRVVDAWSDGFKEPANRFQRLGGGNHQITIEFYERGGAAFNRVWWWRDGGGSSGSSGGGGIPRDD